MEESQIINNSLLLATIIVLAAPAISFIISLLLIPDTRAWLSPIVSVILLLISTVGSLFIFLQAPADLALEFSVPWLKFSEKVITMGLLIDINAIRMITLVTTISFLVHLFSIGYMEDDTKLTRYFAFLGLFTFGMLLLSVANNVLLLFVGWEVVGFCSYILIGHWIERPAAGRAALQAFVINRLGDLGFILALMMLWSSAGTFDIVALSSIKLDQDIATAISLGLFWAVMAKSAQFPLFSWLPDAMEGPTPVSALIHAATMVVAGIYLMIRINWLFTPFALDAFVIIGALTAVIGALCALSQFDIKRILAYSTISQLGFMVIAIGTSSGDSSFLHLWSHGFFKAALFLGAGAIIHAMHKAQLMTGNNEDVQDIRNLGGLRRSLPFTFIVMVVAAASLSGLPFGSGFTSKDAILSSLVDWSYGNTLRYSVVVIALLTTLLTVLYTGRLLHFVFLGRGNHSNISESPWIMRIPMFVLALFSTWLAVGIVPFSAANWNVSINSVVEAVSIVVVVGGGVFAWNYFRRQKTAGSISKVLENGLYLERLNGQVGIVALRLGSITTWIDRSIIDKFFHAIAYINVAVSFLISWLDRTFVDGIINLIAASTGLVGKFTRSFQGGSVQLYIFWSIFGLIIFLFFMFK